MPPSMDHKLLLLAQRHWHRQIGLVFAIIAAFIFESLVLTHLNVGPIGYVIIYSITFLALFAIWVISNRLPKTAKGKVGFVVCLQCSNEEENKRIREDFVTTLRDLLKQGASGRAFDFIEIPQHIAETITDLDAASTLKYKTNAHFLIYGRVRFRTLDGKDYHIIDLNGVVAHRPLPIEVSKNLANEFSELFPRNIRIQTENDLLSFNFTSDWTECVAKYIIGIASVSSGDLDFAEKLFKDVQQKLNNLPSEFQVFAKLRERLPIRFSEIYQARAISFLNLWRKALVPDDLDQFVINTNKIPADLPQDYGVLLLRGFEAFLNGRDTAKAINFMKKCKQYDDVIWHFNLAFLNAYEGNLAKTIQYYRTCCNYDITPKTIEEVEEFMVWMLEAEPDKYQFHYCLGFFNWKIKEDLQRALTDFEEFLAVATDDTYGKEKTLAMEWRSQIKNQLDEAARLHKTRGSLGLEK